MIQTYQTLLEMMTPQEKRRFWQLVIITFVLSAFETISLVAILPFLHIVANPDVVQTNGFLNWLYTTFGFSEIDNFLIALGIAVFMLTVSGLIAKTLTVWVMTRFALMRSYSLSARLLENYLNQPYEWFLQQHSSSLGNAVLAEVDKVVGESLLPAMRLIPEIFSASLLLLALCLLEPWVAIVGAMLLGSTYGTIFILVRRLLMRLGGQRYYANRRRFHITQEATGGVKELKVLGLENAFLRRFRDAAFEMANTLVRIQVLSVLPRYLLESVAFGGMLLLILILMLQGDGNISELIPTLGIVATVGLRMIPSLQQIYSRGTSLRQSHEPLTRIHQDITKLSFDRPPDETTDGAPSVLPLMSQLELNGVEFTYPGKSKPALKKLNLTITANTTIGVVGGTGAGKTTLIDVLLGLLRPAAGTILVDGQPIGKHNLRHWQRSLGYVPQTIFLSDGSILENIAFGIPLTEIDRDAAERAARIAAIHDFITTELPEGYDAQVGERGVRLSGGQRQRIGIARALYHDPSTLIFDEATSALDPMTEAAVMDAVHRMSGKTTIIMIAHRLSTVRDCDHIILLRDGKVSAEGTFDKIREQDEEFRHYS